MDIQDFIITRVNEDIYEGMIFCGGSVHNYSTRANEDFLFDTLKSKLTDEKVIYVLFKSEAMFEIYSDKLLTNNVAKIIQFLFEVCGTSWHHLDIYSDIEGEFKFTSINIDEFKFINNQYIDKYKN